MKQEFTLLKYLGGSHLYGLNTPESDTDEREIFMNTDPAYILGTKRFDQEVRNNEKEDVQKTEIRKFLELARKGNTQSVEVLFAKEDSFQDLHWQFKELRANREKLVDSDVLFKVISSFIHAQKFLIFDDKRKAEVGSKRASKIDQFGYNPKAASTAIRLAWSGINYYKSGMYPVQSPRTGIAGQIKFTPENFKPDEVRTLVEDYDRLLKEAYEDSLFKTYFDEKYANDFLLNLYRPHLTK